MASLNDPPVVRDLRSTLRDNGCPTVAVKAAGTRFIEAVKAVLLSRTVASKYPNEVGKFMTCVLLQHDAFYFTEGVVLAAKLTVEVPGVDWGKFFRRAIFGPELRDAILEYCRCLLQQQQQQEVAAVEVLSEAPVPVSSTLLTGPSVQHPMVPFTQQRSSALENLKRMAYEETYAKSRGASNANKRVKDEDKAEKEQNRIEKQLPLCQACHQQLYYDFGNGVAVEMYRKHRSIPLSPAMKEYFGKRTMGEILQEHGKWKNCRKCQQSEMEENLPMVSLQLPDHWKLLTLKDCERRVVLAHELLLPHLPRWWLRWRNDPQDPRLPCYGLIACKSGHLTTHTIEEARRNAEALATTASNANVNRLRCWQKGREELLEEKDFE